MLRKREVTKCRRRPVGVRETITSGKKKDPREAEKKGGRSDYRGKEGEGGNQGRPAPPLAGREKKEGRKEGRKGQREKGKFTPRGKCPNRSTALLCRCRLRRRHRRRVVHSSLSLCSVQSLRGYRRVQIYLPCRPSICQGCLIFIEDLSFPLRCAGRITISHKIVGMLCFNCCFRHEYDAASTAAASVRYRRVVGNEEEKIRRVKTRNKGGAMTEI